MKGFRNCLLFSIMLVLSTSYVQAENYVFAPFVSRLKAVEENSSIKLTWKDSGDVDGTYLIYRHTEKIGRNNFPDAFQVAEVGKGVQNYTDTAMAGTDFYYSVLLKNREGKIYDIFIPYRNVTSNPVSLSSIRKIDDNLTYITYLRVSEKKDSLFLTFRSSNPDRNIAVLRSTEAVFTSDDLKNADLLSVIPSERDSYTDYPIAGIPYYYTVVDAELLKSYRIDIIPFENTTITPSEIRITDQVISSYRKTLKIRPEPLPAVHINRNIETGEKLLSAYSEFFPEKKISTETEAVVISLMKENTEENKPEPELLNSSDFFGQKENIQLSVLLNRYFFKREWEILEEKLRDFIRHNESVSLNRKASFYLGQCYYFTGKHEKAFMEFLLSSENFYPESKKWMDTILLYDQ